MKQYLFEPSNYIYISNTRRNGNQYFCRQEIRINKSVFNKVDKIPIYAYIKLENEYFNSSKI